MSHRWDEPRPRIASHLTSRHRGGRRTWALRVALAITNREELERLAWLAAIHRIGTS